MAVPPRKIRQLPPAQEPSDSDVFPVSQMNTQTGVATTRAMTRAQLQSDLIQVINEARQMFVTQSEETHAYLQEQIDALHTSVENNEMMDEQLQAAIVMIQQMLDGESGKTPYDLWLDAGNTGSLQDFLNTLRGPTGSQGPQGIPGRIGDRGEVGPAGSIGPMGPTGSQGNPGIDGKNGIDGKDGINGLNGEDGEDGERGSVWTSGAGSPSGAANVGDMYLDTTTGDVWRMS